MQRVTSVAHLGSVLRGARMRADLTQAELAKLAGVSRATVINVESGARFDISTLFALAKALDLDVAVTERAMVEPHILDDTEEL